MNTSVRLVDASAGPTTSTPRVTIGMPVYNGAATIEASIRPLLAQTFTDFELLVSDNASTDATREVVERLAREDARIRYVRQPVNIGANGNYSFVAKAARGEFLKWATASDWCAPTFVERCVRALDADPTAVLAAPRTRLFERDIHNATEYTRNLAVGGDSPLERLKEFWQRLALNNSFNGVIRLDSLRRTRLVEPYSRADEVLMGHLAMLGRFLLVDEPLFYRRMEVGTSTVLQSPRERVRHHYPQAGARRLLQVWKHQLGWFRAGLAAPMSLRERSRVMALLVRRFAWERGALMQDAWNALRFWWSGAE